MKTDFTLAQLADPDVARANEILRACVHCGFCTATCPTYVMLGDERDSPRGRIYLIKDMLERGAAAPASVTTHVDRCLSCLSCMTTCPSGVHYMHLVDYARVRIEETGRRPFAERMLRALLAVVLPRPRLFRLALWGALPLRPFARALPGRLRTLVEMAPRRLPKRSADLRPGRFPARGRRRARVSLLAGCAQRVLAPEINRATVRLLTRHGCEVTVAGDSGCCGALTHHMGRREEALRAARRNVAAWRREIDGEGLDAIVVNASGCGTTVKDYGHMLRGDPQWADGAAAVAGRTRDITEWLEEIGPRRASESPPPPGRIPGGVFAAARPEGDDGAASAAQARRLRGCRAGGGASVLRVGGNLQFVTAAARSVVAAPQARRASRLLSRYRRQRQYRLHDPAGGRRGSGSAHRAAARLGHRWPRPPHRSDRRPARMS